jgi:hypothetical protein
LSAKECERMRMVTELFASSATSNPWSACIVIWIISHVSTQVFIGKVLGSLFDACLLCIRRLWNVE